MEGGADSNLPLPLCVSFLHSMFLLSSKVTHQVPQLPNNSRECVCQVLWGPLRTRREYCAVWALNKHWLAAGCSLFRSQTFQTITHCPTTKPLGFRVMLTHQVPILPKHARDPGNSLSLLSTCIPDSLNLCLLPYPLNGIQHLTPFSATHSRPAHTQHLPVTVDRRGQEREKGIPPMCAALSAPWTQS